MAKYRAQLQVPSSTNWKTLSMFIIFGVAGLLVTVLIRDLSVYQQFYLRVFIGLSAAGIAAIIPGFFRIDVAWLQNTIKAGGAIAIFVLIYKINPPSVHDFKVFEGVSGKWYYDLHPTSDSLGFKSRHYGGVLYFNEIQDEYGTNLSMNGTVEWRYNENDSLVFLKQASGFRTLSGGVTADGRLVYEYKTLDFGKEMNGFISLDILRDENKKISGLSGTFYRTSEPHVTGAMYIRKEKPYYEVNGVEKK